MMERYHVLAVLSCPVWCKTNITVSLVHSKEMATLASNAGKSRSYYLSYMFSHCSLLINYPRDICWFEHLLRLIYMILSTLYLTFLVFVGEQWCRSWCRGMETCSVQYSPYSAKLKPQCHQVFCSDSTTCLLKNLVAAFDRYNSSEWLLGGKDPGVITDKTFHLLRIYTPNKTLFALLSSSSYTANL